MFCGFFEEDLFTCHSSNSGDCSTVLHNKAHNQHQNSLYNCFSEFFSSTQCEQGKRKKNLYELSKNGEERFIRKGYILLLGWLKPLEELSCLKDVREFKEEIYHHIFFIFVSYFLPLSFIFATGDKVFFRNVAFLTSLDPYCYQSITPAS